MPPMGVPGTIPPGPDPVSGALNTAAFSQEFGRVVSSDRADLALWFLDLRNFRVVNPKHGYDKGNWVLRCVATCIRDQLSHDLPVCRLGGDRFAFLTEGISPDQTSAAVERLTAAVTDALVEQGIAHPVGFAAGVYYLRDEDFESRNSHHSIDCASIAHRTAHDDKRCPVAVFTDEDLERDLRRIAIESSIDEALTDGSIEVWYEPQFDYVLGEVIGAEAHVRWEHPTLGVIPPSEFLPVLEASGKVHDLDLYVWEEACRNASRWRSVADGNPVPISVQISRQEMFEPDLIAHFLELREKYSLPAGCLRFEVAERTFAEDTERVYGIVEELRANDMVVEMDGFGNGLSSINMLKEVPVDVVKLDMSLMGGASEDENGVVLSSVVSMLQGLDTPIIAEGVETLEQAEMLKNMGCRLMQGSHFSHAMPLSEFESFLASNRTVERAEQRKRKDSNFDQLLSFDGESSFIFNNVIGGTMFFIAGDEVTESILANDQFLKECGFDRDALSAHRINLLDELQPESHSTLWRAVAEAREYGSAICRARIRKSGRWILCVMRYLGDNPRGMLLSLNVIYSGEAPDRRFTAVQAMQDMAFDIDMLAKIVPSGFVKCAVDEALTISYISPKLLEVAGLTREDHGRIFHNSLMSMVSLRDRRDLEDAVEESGRTDEAIRLSVGMRCGFEPVYQQADLIVHTISEPDDEGGMVTWLYALVMLADKRSDADEAPEVAATGRVITFEYTLADDVLRLRVPTRDGGVREAEVGGWLAAIDDIPANIAPESAARVLATVRDVRHHPTSGFFDIKYALNEGDDLRWFHVSFLCDANDEGDTVTVHGFVQDANDQMGSVRWWRKQAERDGLTGLLNRSATEQHINLSMRSAGTGAMFVIDLDGFKRVNDVLGHLAGDELLRNVADVLRSSFRETDVVGRYGGDEFCAFMALSDADAREIVARRAAQVVAAVSAIETSGDIRVGASIGIAISHDRTSTFYDLLEAADAAMYDSKSAGKGTYTICNV